jgi:hypothetical protein
MKTWLSKCRVLTPTLLSLFFAGMVPSNVTAAAPATHSVVGGFTAELSFTGTLGSTETVLQLSATQGQGQSPSSLSVSVFQNDPAMNTSSCYFGTVGLTASEFQIADSLQTASLDIHGVTLSSCGDETSVTADISITWTGSGGPPNVTNSTFLYGNGGFRVHERVASRQRDATVAGSFLLEGTNVLAGVPDPDFSFATISKDSRVIFVIQKP